MRKDDMNEIIGVIYPIPTTFANRLFEGKVRVFVKYLAHNSTKLLPRHKVIFYASHGQKKLIGEGTIEKVEFLNPDIVLAKYKEVLFLREDEFLAYVKNRKEMLTLTLKKLVRYPTSISYINPITMAGKYIRKEEYNTLKDSLNK